MWGVEHSIMAFVAGCLALFLLGARNWLWLGAVLLSQVPFWVGLIAYSITGDKNPVNINLAFNLMVASSFMSWADRLQRKHAGGIVQVRVCLTFLLAGGIDITMMVHPVEYYTYMQEFVHYLALILIGGRAYVVRYDGLGRSVRNRPDSKAGGDLV